MTSRYPFRGLVLAPIATALAGAALAGRPLTVDDAGTNAASEGHVEIWMARAKEARSWNISPAYALRDGLEFSALLSRKKPAPSGGPAGKLLTCATPRRGRGAVDG
jgi:hypothetical protein